MWSYECTGIVAGRIDYNSHRPYNLIVIQSSIQLFDQMVLLLQYIYSISRIAEHLSDLNSVNFHCVVVFWILHGVWFLSLALNGRSFCSAVDIDKQTKNKKQSDIQIHSPKQRENTHWITPYVMRMHWTMNTNKASKWHSTVLYCRIILLAYPDTVAEKKTEIFPYYHSLIY